MKLTPVKSSNIEAAGFDPATRTLTVKFRNGGTYHYADCHQHHFDGLCSAESAGKYLHKHIRPAFKHSKANASPR
jgi:hypothetical protein